ncbi:MAG TPA: FtsX-like permease family protein [Planctomycetota bacterium]|nr:FtsX-like permease family protein [Planctomycetota bacterium]
MLPFSYALRNLWRRRARTLATILGIALTTLLVIVMTAFAGGLERAGGKSARDDVVVLVGTSSEADLVRSVVPRGNAENAAAAAPGVYTRGGLRAASVELHIATRTGNRIGLLRGVTPAAYLVRPQVTVVEGREPREPFELMVGRLAATRMGLDPAELAVGRTIRLEQRDWTISGRFAAPDTILEAELWCRLEDLMLATKREDVSCVALRLESPDRIPDVNYFAAKRLDLEVVAVPERTMMATLERGLVPIVALARWMAILVLVGGGFACANTMFAAVLARTRELGTLRALGYSPAAVAVALLEESLLVAFVGGAIGIFLALAIGNMSIRFPMGAFTLDLDVSRRALGLAAALGSGLLGGFVPAWRAVRMPLTDALGGKA